MKQTMVWKELTYTCTPYAILFAIRYTGTGNEVFKQTKVTLPDRVNNNMKFESPYVHKKSLFQMSHFYIFYF